jgi:hypothetical protein
MSGASISDPAARRHRLLRDLPDDGAAVRGLGSETAGLGEVGVNLVVDKAEKLTASMIPNDFDTSLAKFWYLSPEPHLMSSKLLAKALIPSRLLSPKLMPLI